jgi:hypothetical protein
VSGHELSSIQGLEDKHLRALARQGITDLRGLVEAELEVIYRGTANLRPRPPRGLIARWQDDAGNLLAAAAPGPEPSGWQTAASFVVVFSQRQTGETWERQVEAEQTEVEPERNAQIWPGWEARPICDWMVEQLGPGGGAESTTDDVGSTADDTESTVDDATDESGEADEVDEGEEAPRGAGDAVAAPRPALRIDSATIIDAAGRVNLLATSPADPARELAAPARVTFTVRGVPPSTPLRAVARVQRRDGPGWNVADPLVVPGSGQVEFDLAGVPAGEYEVALIAWAPDAAARPVSVLVPTVTIRPGW